MAMGTPPRSKGERAGRIGARAAERLKEAARAHGAIMLLLGGLMVLRVAVFIAFSALLGIGNTDPVLFRTIIVIDSALGVVLDLVIVFVALILFSTIRRVETESDRMQVFMDSVYRRLP